MSLVFSSHKNILYAIKYQEIAGLNPPPTINFSFIKSNVAWKKHIDF